MEVNFGPEYTSRTIILNGKKVLSVDIYVEFESLEEKWKKSILHIDKDHEGTMVTDKKNNVYYNPENLRTAPTTASE